jgi:hypothetical protein
MNKFSKLMLSDEEQQLVNNPEFILTKRIIIDKVCSLLAMVLENQKATLSQAENWLPLDVIKSSPKIAKGENYLLLPYVMLDYPRCFDGDNIFAVRTMFWWGNFFSITLQLSGQYKEKFENKIIENSEKLQTDFFICINENQWQHHFEADNYIPVEQVNKNEFEKLILQKSFVKLAAKFPLQHWNDVPALLDNFFTEIIEMLKD